MSALLLQAVVDQVRAAFTPAELAEVRPYGGEFSTEEIDQAGFRSPAAFVTVLGWKPGSSKRLVGRNVHEVRLAAFVVYKATDRQARMGGAMVLAEKLCLALRRWRPTNAPDAPISIAPLEAEAEAENLYGRAVDKKGLALWLVRWTQAVQLTASPDELWDLLSVDIVDLTRRGEVPTAPAPDPNPLSVTEDVRFPT
ncbi:hypothetical protein CKO44_07775 [Rubrivivax gelatinosus]|uniref:hypothetical protein n=1 Tax=Rubrivivax gelatinosus TaxID=28068 RepID=UPI0019072CD5|nr:hypothetical protein [Rubrivivax gelatinosus]MBK1613367.1 hypothetical protein [Rubrivivax gelatinosus]MBZ8143073.1 hypothetical protein [Rubrivivax gelatinosus]